MRGWSFGLAFAAGLCASEADAGPPGHNPDLDHKCGPGFVWSRNIVACAQNECPTGARRTYTLVCNCGEAWGEPTKTCFDPKRPGFATHCVAKGESCDGKAKAQPRATPKRPPVRTPPAARPRPVRRPQARTPRERPPPPTCTTPLGSSYDASRESCACPTVTRLRPDGLACESGVDRASLQDMQVCVAEQSGDADAIYSEIGQRLSSPPAAAETVYERAAAAVASKRVPAALAGIVVPAPRVADDETCAVRKPDADVLSADDQQRIEEIDRALNTGRPPKWVRRIPDDDGLLYNVGAAVVANAPSSISGVPSCARAKYVYATALPILNKEFGLWQLSGAGPVGMCRALVGARGRMRIANLGRTVIGSDVKSPTAILRESKQGTCGEWAYGLREVMVGAGFPRARVINSYIPGFSGTLNHAAAVVECVNDGVVEQRVCDAWALGHQNQSGRVYGEAGFAGAATAVHNCRPVQEWKQAQRASWRTGFEDPDRDDDLGDFKTERDLALEWLDGNFAERAITVARRGRSAAILKGVLISGLRGLMPYEQDAELRRRIEATLPTVTDLQVRSRMARWVLELRE